MPQSNDIPPDPGGSDNFIISTIEGSFDAGKVGSFKYYLTPEQLAGGRRWFRLFLNINCQDMEGMMYRDAVFNHFNLNSVLDKILFLVAERATIEMAFPDVSMKVCKSVSLRKKSR